VNDLARYSESVLCSMHLVELRLVLPDPTVSPMFVQRNLWWYTQGGGKS